MTVQERADQIAEWAELTAQKEILLAQVAPKAPHRPEGGERQSARDLGLDRNEVEKKKEISQISEISPVPMGRNTILPRARSADDVLTRA